MLQKENIQKLSKKELYSLYELLVLKPKKYKEVTKIQILLALEKRYQEDIEILFSLFSAEEINLLKILLDHPIKKNEINYIDYLCLEHLKKFLLVIETDTYSIPEDMLNYVKMANNIYEAKVYFKEDVTSSAILGLLRIYGVLTLNELCELLNNFECNFTPRTLKDYINNNIRLKELVNISKIKKETVVYLKENIDYKEVYLSIDKEDFKKPSYRLEEVISIGKFRINLFNQEILTFLTFLEMHLPPSAILLVLEDLLIYAAIDINNKEVLKKICFNEELLKEGEKIVNFFPCWFYNGNSIHTLRENFLSQKKN